MEIASRRKSIDRMDRELVRLLNQRIAAAIEIGRIKKAGGLPLRDAQRERQIVCRAKRVNGGPLDRHTLESFFKWLLAESRRQTARALNGQMRRNGRTKP